MKRTDAFATLMALSMAACGRSPLLDAYITEVDADAGQFGAGADASDAGASQSDLDASVTDVDAGPVEPCDAGTACLYSCEAGLPVTDNSACGNYSADNFGCTDGVNASYGVGCVIWLPSCLSPADRGAGCVCSTVPLTQEPDAMMITLWACPP
ncbi:MAG: hypothetical protein WBY94_30935 [Polyangiaceae bacterium]